MNAKQRVAAIIAAGLLAGVSLTAVAFGGEGKSCHEEMRAYHDAVMSGALTDAELVQLKQDRQAAYEQMRKIRNDLKTRTEALINNDVRGPKRDQWPEELAGSAHRMMRIVHNDAPQRPLRGN